MDWGRVGCKAADHTDKDRQTDRDGNKDRSELAYKEIKNQRKKRRKLALINFRHKERVPMQSNMINKKRQRKTSILNNCNYIEITI